MDLALAFKFARALSELSIAHLYGKEGSQLAEVMVANKQLVSCKVLRSTGLVPGYRLAEPPEIRLAPAGPNPGSTNHRISSH